MHIVPHPDAPDQRERDVERWYAIGMCSETESRATTESGAQSPTHERPATDESPLEARVEAVLLSTDRPLGPGRLLEVLGMTDEPGAAQAVQHAVDTLNREYARTGRTFRIEQVAGGRRILTLPQFGPLLDRLHGQRHQARLSQAALETLSIIAYRQPVLRAELEAIRGVACGEVLRGLMERRLVRIVGRAEELGRPMLYGTTREFLQVFGLSSLEDLPKTTDNATI